MKEEEAESWHSKVRRPHLQTEGVTSESGVLFSVSSEALVRLSKIKEIFNPER